MAGLGRPSKYSDQIAGEICRMLAKGVPLARVCDLADMPSYTTVRRWEDENPAFRALSTRAKQDGTHFLADDALRIADDESIDTQRAKLMIDTRLRLIGKWNAKAYGDKIEQTVQGADGGPVQTETKLDLSALSADQLRALASIKVTE
jgi:hypothetical protein